MMMTIMNGIAMMMGRGLGDATATPHITPRRASSIMKRRENNAFRRETLAVRSPLSVPKLHNEDRFL
jgi:hypothetical protein